MKDSRVLEVEDEWELFKSTVVRCAAVVWIKVCWEEEKEQCLVG